MAPGLLAGFSLSGIGQIVLGLSAIALNIGFSPDLDSLAGSQKLLAENLSIFASPTAVRGVVFGRAGIAGQILFRQNIRNSGDTPDELLIILGLAGYPANSLEKFWLNEELVFDGDSTTGPGAITTGKFADDLWVWFRTGEETSDAFPDIATLSGFWNAKTRILRGMPSIGIRVKITEAMDGRLQPLAQIKGSKLYDPRLDSTVPGGSGAHRFDDPATWEWSENPKLAELLYLRGADVASTKMFGMGKAAAAIDLESFAAEANVCEEQINVVGGGTIDRYTCNGLLIPNADHKTNLQRLLSASAGTMDASGGVYRTFAGAWRASSMTLNETDIDGAPTTIQLQIDQSQEINVIGGAFAEPAEMWVVKEYPELTDSASIALFGENAKKFDLPFTTDHRIAQRIAKIQLKRLNAKRAFNANYWLRAASLQPGDIVTQTYTRYGITAETFRVDLWALEASEDASSSRRLIVPMSLVEELQSWFDWDETTEEKSINAGAVLPAMDEPRLTEVFYIKPITGTAIQNGAGTLTLEAHRIFAGVDELLSTGTIQLFEGATLITVANGYAAGSDGYTGVLDSGDISGSVIIELKDGAGGTILDSITLVDVADGATGGAGADAVYGSIEPENGLAWTQAVNGGAWTPTQLTSDLDCTFYQAGVAVARIARRITLASGTGFLSSSTVAHEGGDLNTGRVTVTVSGGGTQAITVEFAYSFGGELATVAETLKAVQGGDDGSDGSDSVTGFVEPENGIAWTRAPNSGAWTPSQLTSDLDVSFLSGGVIVARIARRVTLSSGAGTLTVGSIAHKGGDLNTSRVTVTVIGSGTTAVTVQFDYSFGGETGSIAQTLVSAQGGDDGAAGSPGADGGDAITGFVEPENGLAWSRAPDAGAWTPSQLTTDLDVTFTFGGTVVARIARRITLTEATGNLAATSTAHKGGDLNTGRVTVTVSGGGSTAITVQFDYSFGGDTGSAAATVESVQGGLSPVTGFISNEAAIIPCDGNGDNCDFSTANGEFKVFEGVTEKTADATFSEISETDVTGTINTAVDTPVSGQPKGYYEVTAITSNNGVLKIRAVFGGVTIDKDFNLTRNIAPLGVTIPGAQVNESVANGAVNPIPNSSKTATGSGGNPAYTYQWVRTSGDTELTFNSPTSATTTFRSSGGTNEQFQSFFRCDIDDAVSAGPVASNTFRLSVIHGTLP